MYKPTHPQLGALRTLGSPCVPHPQTLRLQGVKRAVTVLVYLDPPEAEASLEGKGPFLGDGWKVGEAMDFHRFIHNIIYNITTYCDGNISLIIIALI